MKICPLCSGSVRKTTTEMSFFNDKIQVSPVKAEICMVCGEKFLDKKETERLRHKVNAIKKAMQKERIKRIEITI